MITVIRSADGGRTYQLGENTAEAARQAARAEAAADTTQARIDDAVANLPANFKGDKGDPGGPGPAGSVSDYTGVLTSTGGNGIRQTMRVTGMASIDGSGRDTAVDFNFGRARAYFEADHAGSGAPYFYYDGTAFHGINFTPGAARINTAMPALGWFYEPMFWQQGVFAFEHQLRFQGLDEQERRPLQFFLPHDGGSVRDIANAQFQVDLIRGHDWLDQQRFQWNLRTGVMNLSVGTQFSFDGNNEQIFKQKNKAGTAFLALPHIDDYDNTRFEQPITGIVTCTPTNALGSRHAFGLFSFGHTAGSNHVYFEAANDVAGQLFAKFKANANFYDFLIENGKAGGRSRFMLQGNQASAVFGWYTGTHSASAGVDHASGEFRICPEYLGLTGAQGISMRLSDARTSFHGRVRLQSLVNAADDTAAAAAGVEVNEIYRNGSALMVRVS